MRTLYCYMDKHLGDHIFAIHYLRQLVKENPDTKFICYLKQCYMEEIANHIQPYQNNITLTHGRAPNEAFCLWYGSFPLTTGYRHGCFYINERYQEFNSKMAQKLSLNYNPNNTTLLDNDLILQNNKHTEQYDILLINAKPLSGQYIYFEDQFIYKANEWKEQYKIITTDKIKGVDLPCTRDYKLNVFEIANLSINAKYIVGVATAPIIPCFNKWNIDKVTSWHVLSKRSCYSYNDRIFRYKSVLHVKL